MGRNLVDFCKFRLVCGFPDADFVFGEVFFGFQCRHAAGSGGGDGLAEDLVLHVARCEHASDRGAVLPGTVRM